MAKTSAKATGSKSNEPAFEDILSRLTTVVDELEGGEMALERSLELFEEGVRLSRQGSTRLDHAELRIERLLNDSGETEAMLSADKETESQ